MSGLEINTKKLGEIYKEWRGNESCYDNGRPVFEADDLLDFAQFCLKHEANVFSTGEGQSNISDVIGCLTENQLNEIILHLHEYGTMTDKYCYGLPTGEEDMIQMRGLIIGVLKNNR